MTKRPPRFFAVVFMLLLIFLCPLVAQTTAPLVPRILKYSGSAPAGTFTVTFAVYDRQDAAAPLWLESQSVSTDDAGHYTVLLGSTTAEGVPAGIFASGEARWIGVKIDGEPESVRSLLVSVPYALKAGDAETLGGKPLSAFVMAESTPSASASPADASAKALRLQGNAETNKANPEPSGANDSGNPNFIAKFVDTTNLGNSAMFESGGNVGIGTTSPQAVLDVATPGANIGLGTNFAGLNQLVKGFTPAHLVSNVPAQLNLGLNDGAFTGLNIKDFRDGSFNSAAIEFTTHHGGVSAGTRMILDKDGKLGLGTSVPSALFDLGSAGGDIALGTNFQGSSQLVKAFTSPHSPSNTPSQISVGLLDSVFTGMSVKDVRDGSFNSASLEFSTHHGGVSFGTRMVLDKDGRLGLGTLFPATLLDVEGDIGVGNNSAGLNQVVKVFSTAHSTQNVPAQINLGLMDAAFTGISVKDVRDGSFNSASIEFSTHHGGVSLGTRMLIDKDGNVGINNSAPLARLDVLQTAAGTGGFSTSTPPPSSIHGDTTATSGFITGVLGTTSSVDGYGIIGENLASGPSTSRGAGVRGITANTSSGGVGVWGDAEQVSGNNTGVYGSTNSSDDAVSGVIGVATATGNTAGDTNGVYGVSMSSGLGIGVFGETKASSVSDTSRPPTGVYGLADTVGVAGLFDVGAASANILIGRLGTSRVFRVDSSGKVFADGNLQASGADFAESVSVLEERSAYEPGDVIAIDTTGVRRFAKSTQPYSTLVAGIYSTKPGVLATPHHMDDPRITSEEIPLAVVGIVPCKVTNENGDIHAGDLLVSSSTPGYAMKATDRARMTGAVVGKALGALQGKQGTIEVLVSLQ